MAQNLKACVIQIRGDDGSVKGTGFIIDSHTAVTCAHVVEAAGAAPGEKITIAFALAGDTCSAEILPDAWLPTESGDIAILHLHNGLPAGVSPAILGPSDDTANHLFRAFGYPEVGEMQGVWAEGKILGPITDSQGTKMLQLRAQEIAQGMSGAPVLDTNADRVVGMVTATYTPDKTLKLRDAAFATPIEVIFDVWPLLELIPPSAPSSEFKGLRDYIARAFSDHYWLATFVISLLIITLSVDLTHRLVIVKPGIAEWMVAIVLALLSLLIVGSTLTLTGRRAFLKENRQISRIKVLITVTALWLIALIVAWFMRPTLAKFYNNRGALAHRAGALDEAQNNYLRALSWNPEDGGALFNLGVIYEEMGKCEKAVGWYEGAMESDPAFVPAYNNLARLYIFELCPEIQNPKRASNLLETARDRLQKQPVSPEFSTEVNYALAKNLGWAYLVEERYADAGRELRAAINLVEERAAAHCLLAQVLEKTTATDKDAALHEWRDCLAFGPDTTLYEENRWASIARERLGGQ